LLTVERLVYVFRVMTCDEYYETHPEPFSRSRDRCDLPEIGSSTSKAVALLGFSTTLFGVPNLFLTGYTIKKFGIKTALLIQVSWVAVRLLIQNAGVEVGKGAGIIIIQCSQIITIIGGPVGYLLALNSFITEVVTSSERTPSLGRLQGYALCGSATGYLFGGLLSDWFSIKAPFRVALVLFSFCSLYIFLVLPWTPPNANIETRTSQGIAKFFGPLKKFAPQKWVLRNGTVQTEYGALLLGIGVFFGILATGYITVLLQMYSTDVLGFGAGENGVLVSLNFFLRGLFLAIAFPRIIKAGRIWLKDRTKSKSPSIVHTPTESIVEIPTEPDDIAAVDEAAQEPIDRVKSNDDDVSYDFDLFYCKFSLILDGILTGAATFVRQGWQIYVVAILIPFAAGTGSASKGTILQMCPASDRVEALSGITLIEMIARLSTSM
jgi:hypothetical protein